MSLFIAECVNAQAGHFLYRSYKIRRLAVQKHFNIPYMRVFVRLIQQPVDRYAQALGELTKHGNAHTLVATLEICIKRCAYTGQFRKLLLRLTDISSQNAQVVPDGCGKLMLIYVISTPCRNYYIFSGESKELPSRV